jgi:hypothetical protein
MSPQKLERWFPYLLIGGVAVACVVGITLVAVL